MAERQRPEVTAAESDLCDHWIMLADQRCQNYWRQEFELVEKVEVGGHTMWGTYGPGVWRFCNMHARIFLRDQKP